MIYADGIEVYHWPEFKALAKRLGISHKLPTTNLTITIPIGGVVLVAHDYLGYNRHLQPEESEPSQPEEVED